MNSDYQPPVNPKRELYRDPSRGKICGVCVGVADYFGIEVWVIRIIAVTALLFFQFPILIAYLVGYFVLEPKPGTSKHDKFKSKKKQFHNDSYTNKKSSKSADHQSASVQQVWKKGRVPGQRLKTLNSRFKSLENRLQNMETHVTSKQFELRKEFEELSSKQS
jgi:phage shock protein C